RAPDVVARDLDADGDHAYGQAGEGLGRFGIFHAHEAVDQVDDRRRVDRQGQVAIDEGRSPAVEVARGEGRLRRRLDQGIVGGQEGQRVAGAQADQSLDRVSPTLIGDVPAERLSEVGDLGDGRRLIRV